MLKLLLLLAMVLILAAEVPVLARTPTPDGWLTYTDPDFSFSIDYPPDFTIEDTLVTGTLPAGILRSLRAVDREFSEGYPPGHVEFGILVKDAATLEEWLAKHTRTAPIWSVGDPFPSYFRVTNVTSTKAGDRGALSFDVEPGGEVPGTVRHVIFLLGPNVFEIAWFATESYESTIRPIFDQMLASFNDSPAELPDTGSVPTDAKASAWTLALGAGLAAAGLGLLALRQRRRA